MSTKKRKTPSSPRHPFAEDSGRVRGSRNARLDPSARTLIGVAGEDLYEGPDFGDEKADPSEATLTDLPVLPPAQGARSARGEHDEELLDLGPLDRSQATSADDEHRVDGPDAVPERRLTATLLRIFARRRAQIGLSIEQLARLSGVSLTLLEAFENPAPGQTITYDQVVVLARVLGVPTDEMPGLRRRESRAHLGITLADLERTLLAAPLLRYEGAHGERYGGDVERAAASKAFTVRIEDDSLSPIFLRGMLLGFMSGVTPRVGGILLLRHRRSSLLALRRHEPPSYAGLCPWQPSYVAGGEWHLCGALEVVLPPR